MTSLGKSEMFTVMPYRILFILKINWFGNLKYYGSFMLYSEKGEIEKL